MKKSGIIFGGVLVGLIILGLFAIKMYNKPHQGVIKAAVVYSLMADDIMEHYRTNDKDASQKYNGEVIAISGSLKDYSNATTGLNYLIISGKEGLINCEMENLQRDFSIEKFRNKQLTIKGICVGYDDLLGELQLKKCTIISH